MLWTSTVLPPWMCSTSPSFIAEPDGMLSVHIMKPITSLRQPSGAERRHRRQHGGGAGHVHLHRRVHRVARLQADATGVVHDPLADQGEVAAALRCALRPVRQLDQARLLAAAGVDAEQAAAAELGEAVDVEHLDAEAGVLADLGRQVRRGGSR